MYVEGTGLRTAPGYLLRSVCVCVCGIGLAVQCSVSACYKYQRLAVWRRRPAGWPAGGGEDGLVSRGRGAEP